MFALKATGEDTGRKILECEGRIAGDGHIGVLEGRIGRNPDAEDDVIRGGGRTRGRIDWSASVSCRSAFVSARRSGLRPHRSVKKTRWVVSHFGSPAIHTAASSYPAAT